MNFRPTPLDTAVPVDLALEPEFRLGETFVRPSLLEVSRGGKATTLEPRVMQVLTVLARRPGSVTSRDELVVTCWAGRIVSEDAIQRTIAKLRHAAEADAGGDFFIETVPRVGYRLLVRGTPPAETSAAWPLRRLRPWLAVAVSALTLLAAGGAWWMFRPQPHAATLQLDAVAVLGRGVPAELPALMLEDLRIALGQDNVVVVKARGADLVLRGTLQGVDTDLRYTVRLEDVRDGTMIWSASRDWPADGRFAPRQAAVEASQIVRCGLRGAADHPRRLPTHTLGLFLQQCEARVLSGSRTWERVLALSRRIVAESPDFSRGWSALAFAAMQMSGFPENRTQAAALAVEADSAAARALKLNGQNAEGYAVQALRLRSDRMVEREALLRRAVAAHLSDCGCELLNYANFLSTVGRVREANVWFRRAYDDQPLGAERAVALAHNHEALGQFEQAQAVYDGIGAFYGDDPRLLATRAAGDRLAGRWESSILVVSTTGPPAWRPALLAAMEAIKSKDPARIAAARPAMIALSRQQPGSMIPLLTAVGATDEALRQVEATQGRWKDIAPDLFGPGRVSLLREPGYSRLIEASPQMSYWRQTSTRPDVCGEKNPPAFCAKI